MYKDIIKQQVEIANKLLEEFEVIDPNCIIAGGAPRDWYFDKPANDLDLYIYTPDKSEYERQIRLKHVNLQGLKDLTNVRQIDDMYACMKHLKKVYSATFMGMPINIMFMAEKTFTSVVDHFGTSICKVWYKGDNRINCGIEFLLGEILKQVYVADNYNAKVKHVDKMLKYFPDYIFVPKERFEKDWMTNRKAFIEHYNFIYTKSLRF